MSSEYIAHGPKFYDLGNKSKQILYSETQLRSLSCLERGRDLVSVVVLVVLVRSLMLRLLLSLDSRMWSKLRDFLKIRYHNHLHHHYHHL